MKSIIEDLYFGNIRPFEDLRPQEGPFRRERGEIQADIQAFASKLGPALKKEFDDVMDASAASVSMDLFESFAQGLALGARLLYELCAWPGPSTSWETEAAVDREGISV